MYQGQKRWSDPSNGTIQKWSLYIKRLYIPSWKPLNTTIHWPWYCTLHVCVVINYCDSVWPVWVEGCFIVRLYMHCSWKYNFEGGTGWDPIDRFNHATCLCLSQGRTQISTAICGVRLLCVFSGLRWEVVVRVVDIGGIVDTHC